MPDNGNTRILHFVGYDLGKKVTLMLTFQPPNVRKLYQDEFPLCWAVLKLGETGRVSAEVTYTANTVFFVPQTTSGNIVSAGAAELCNMGQKCEVKNNGDSNVITKAVPGEKDFLQCTNSTPKATDVGIGFSDSTGRYNISPSVVWKDVPSASMVKAKLTPVLKAYETADFKKNEMIMGDIESPELWHQDLMKLGEETTFDVSVDPISKRVSIQIVNTN